MTTSTLDIGISSAKMGGEYVAWFRGTTFMKEDFPLPEVNEYVLVLEDEDDLQVVHFSAVNDDIATAFIAAKYRPPYRIEEVISQYRIVQDLD